MADATEQQTEQHDLPDHDAAREWLESMMLIRRFEERAGEMYAKAKVGGFLHLAIGEEATIVGAVRAMRDDDYLISTYRSHGHALSRGADPDKVMAELFGREDGVSHGRGGSMHMFDGEHRFMGGYGIVGGNLPLAAGMALSSDYRGTEDVTLCVFGDGASNQGTFGETLNLAALWRLPVVFMVTNNQFGMGTSLERHSAVTDLHRRGEGFGVPGLRCDGMDVLDTYAVIGEALKQAREERKPVLVEAITYRFRGHSMADPEEYRSKEQVAEWRKRDPIAVFAKRLEEEGVLDEGEAEKLDEAVVGRIDEAVAFADKAGFPPPESLYDDVYVLGDQVRGWYSVDERSAGVHRGEHERDIAEAERGPKDEYEKAVEQAGREDVGVEKPTDEAQAEDEDAEEAEASADDEASGRGGES
jgi:pyruvate dehydrogenase E1 component alpha subunit